mmetsp:Transcript_2036/g.4416  ORF Transcript_2036/g.4416 Transcript_2036/m.4416 type:complete len:83 (-) Transcript_2036:617-865(-)
MHLIMFALLICRFQYLKTSQIIARSMFETTSGIALESNKFLSDMLLNEEILPIAFVYMFCRTTVIFMNNSRDSADCNKISML